MLLMYVREQFKFFLRNIVDVKCDILIEEDNKNNSCGTNSHTKLMILNKNLKFYWILEILKILIPWFSCFLF